MSSVFLTREPFFLNWGTLLEFRAYTGGILRFLAKGLRVFLPGLHRVRRARLQRLRSPLVARASLWSPRRAATVPFRGYNESGFGEPACRETR